jgi:hypothetical protein
MLHHYTEYMEEATINHASSTITQLIQDYEDLEKNVYTDKSFVKQFGTSSDVVKLFPAF